MSCRLRSVVAAAMLLALTGCAHVGYYLQSIGGQLDVWNRERAIDEVVADPATPGALREKLAAVQRIREFASRELGLPDNASFRRYADLGRPFVVWNVFAAPEFSTKPLQWCFPVAGCVGYRGYFAKADAEDFAAVLAAGGDDVYVGGVPAYSTLGWFADPVLNTFVRYPDPGIARLIFHELARPPGGLCAQRFSVQRVLRGHRRAGRHQALARASRQRAGQISVRADAATAGGFIRLFRITTSGSTRSMAGGLAPQAMRARKREIFEADDPGL